MNHITLQRLRKADERTKAMTKEEYVTWSEYRQASFTFRKSKRFREWAGFGIVTDSRPSDDIVDILGFLTFEMVQTLTEVALDVKEQEEVLHRAVSGDAAGPKKRKLAQGLFDPPSEGRAPVEPRQRLGGVQEAAAEAQEGEGHAERYGAAAPDGAQYRGFPLLFFLPLFFYLFRPWRGLG